jgi:hypothetical protein
MPNTNLPKLTSTQCQTVLDWVAARLRPFADVLAELERPEVLAYLDSIGAPRLDDTVKSLATNATLRIGGGNGNTSWKTQPSYADIDVFLMIPSTDLSDTQTGQLVSLLGRRWTDELLAQRDECTIPGIALAQNGKKRYMDIGKVGTFYNNVIWSVPSMCRHCRQLFNDGKFVVANDGNGQPTIVHESHAGL